MRVVTSDLHRLHAPLAEIEASGLQPPFENPDRADAIHEALRADARFRITAPEAWGTSAIEAVHDPGLVRFLETAWADYQVRHPGTHDVVPDVFSMAALRDGMGPFPGDVVVESGLGRWCFETTTPLTQGTYAAARAAVDVALSTAEAALSGEKVAYGLCRPPGHHAARAMYGGYCFFNNAAVAAHHVVRSTGAKVTVVDVDYHHGNGTQQIFYDRDDVQYVSLHGDPARAYPYVTGYADETGAGAGGGCTLNVPLPAGTDDDAYCARLASALDAVARFGPELVIVSLGVDTYVGDPISDLAVTGDGFVRQGALIAELGLPTVVLQEGGYDVATIGENVVGFLTGLMPR